MRRLWIYRQRQRPYIFLGALCALAGLGGLVSPEEVGRTVIAGTLGHYSRLLWLLCYLIGGLAVLAGTMWPGRPRPELETFGLWAILGGMGVNGVIILGVRGPIAGATTLLSLAFASWMIQGRLHELLEPPVPEPLERRRALR